MAVSSGVERRISPLLRSASLKGSHGPKYVQWNPAPSRPEGSVLLDPLQPPGGRAVLLAADSVRGGFLRFLLILWKEPKTPGERLWSSSLLALSRQASQGPWDSSAEETVPVGTSQRPRVAPPHLFLHLCWTHFSLRWLFLVCSKCQQSKC